MPKFHLRVLLFPGLLSGILLTTSCKKDSELFHPKFNTDLVAPLAYGDLSVFDIIKNQDSVITINPDNTMKIAKSVKVFENDLGYLLNFFNYSNNHLLDLDQDGINFYLHNQTFPHELTASMSNTSVKAVNADIQTGELEIRVQNNLHFAMTNVKITIPGILLGSTPYTRTFPSIAPGTTASAIVDISGYELDLRGKNLDSYNKLYTELELDSMVNRDNLLNFLPGANANYTINIRNIELVRAQGNFGAYLKNYPTEMDFFESNFYKNISSGSVLLNDAKLNINIDNLSGMPFNFRMEAKTTNGVTLQEVSLTPTPDFLILKASENPLTNNPANYREISSATGYNLSQFMSNLPAAVKADITIKNDNVDPTDYSNFIHKDSYVKATYGVDIPLNPSFNEFTLVDTVRFDLASMLGDALASDSKLQLQSGEFRFRIFNGFPYDMNFVVQGYDSVSNKIVATIAANIVIKAGKVNASNIVSEDVATYFPVAISQSLFDNLKKATHVRVTAKLNNKTNANAYKIYTDYNIGFKIIGQIKLKANL